MTDTVVQYCEDYIAVLKRDIMKDDEVIQLAQEIYQNHKNAIDFIIENKPDQLMGEMQTFVEAIRLAGYYPETQNKGYARFLSNTLHDIIPRTGLGGWKNNEQFLFEISYWGKNLTLKAVVGPGHEENRKVLIDALRTVAGSIEPKTKMWSTLHSHKHGLNAMDEKYEDLELLKTDIVAVLKKEAAFIDSVERAIVACKSKLSYPKD
jgi:hypothetical protein